MSGLNAEDERAGQQAAGANREATNYHSDEVTDASRSTPILLQPTPLRPAVTAEPSPLSNDALSKRASRDGHP